MSRRVDLVELGLAFANDLEYRIGYEYAGGLRQWVHLCAERITDDDDRRRCGHCRAELDALAHARRRYCSTVCRKRAHRSRKRDGAAQ